ncbi:unnamed protein product [Acanthoscelides obtectus]|uniref:Uncharacterized protein n=1 Tax=Acanthoscelides obtectus TaxID=200917 RepID=A0A9P0LL20_ACAOB|nr:unnamed protein product [Acanthoscelides obtectus]CAK1634956.1 Trophoblast glycoprotein [Acanthoscelides obtectus]
MLSLKMGNVLTLWTFLGILLCINARVDKCGTLLLDGCFCGQQYHDDQIYFIVNCTGLGFRNTDVLKLLPEETEMLVFTGNHISTLPTNLFGEENNLKRLKIIDMSNNGIHDIKGKAFHHVPNVTRLLLNHNNISISSDDEHNFHHPRVFSNLYNLQELHLTNAFQDNTGAALADDLHDIFVNSNLTKLYKLHLEQNEIKGFKDERVFCDLPELHDIYLGDNNIPSLNFDIQCLPKLRYLDLENNNITSFSKKDLATFDRKVPPFRQASLIIDIAGNPFKCGDAVRELYQWLKTTNVTVRHPEKLVWTI